MERGEKKKKTKQDGIKINLKKKSAKFSLLMEIYFIQNIQRTLSYCTLQQIEQKYLTVRIYNDIMYQFFFSFLFMLEKLHFECTRSVWMTFSQGTRYAENLICLIVKQKGKTTDKEKRNLGKLPLVADCCGKHESYEVVGRFDLEPGYYLLVPYPCESGKETEFFIRILIEKEVDATKNAW